MASVALPKLKFSKCAFTSSIYAMDTPKVRQADCLQRKSGHGQKQGSNRSDMVKAHEQMTKGLLLDMSAVGQRAAAAAADASQVLATALLAHICKCTAITFNLHSRLEVRTRLAHVESALPGHNKLMIR